jgi:hypothetical protein
MGATGGAALAGAGAGDGALVDAFAAPFAFSCGVVGAGTALVDERAGTAKSVLLAGGSSLHAFGFLRLAARLRLLAPGHALGRLRRHERAPRSGSPPASVS